MYPENSLKSGFSGLRALGCRTRKACYVTNYDSFYRVLLQKTNDSFENPNYRLFFGVIVCQYHKMRISEFLRPVLWTEKGLSLHTNQQSNNFGSLFAMQ